MRNGQGFKKRYVVFALVVMLLFYGVWQVIHFSPFEESVIKKVQVNTSTTLYITEGSAGATTRNVYQYYLIPSDITESEFLKGAGDKYVSFLSTSDHNATAIIDSSAIRLTVKGAIYHFTNFASYSTSIYLTASPY
ncbi:hypothetical protein ACQK5W_17135 [Pantoea sp. FN060301]|uniref:hypothetical protein n=1 Tax=Pantoea sp. FN060301 TaxID=3420380 RepID=UPI003D176E7B